MAKTGKTDNVEFNNFFYQKFVNSVPLVSTDYSKDVTLFLGISDATDFIERWLLEDKLAGAPQSEEEKRGKAWRVKQKHIELLHQWISSKRRKRLRDSYTEQIRGSYAPVRIPKNALSKIKEGIEHSAGKITIVQVLTHLVENYLDDALATLSSPQANPLDSIKENGVTCLECGWHGTYLTRHLKHKHPELSPEEYKGKWELPSDWNMVPRKFGKSSD